MDKKRRRLLFYSLFFVFILAGAITILYAEGVRFDFDSFKLEKVGALYVKVFPDQAKIKIGNQDLDASSGFLNDGVLISNLLPDSYNIQISAPDYQSFTGRVQIFPSLVTKINNLVLVPATSSPAATSTASSFWLIGQNFLLKDGNNLFFNNQKIRGSQVAGWTADSGNILTYNGEGTPYFLTSLASTTQTLNLSIFIKNYLPNLSFFKLFTDNQNSDRLILKSANLWEGINIKNYQIYPLNLPTTSLMVNKIQFINNDFYWLDSKNNLWHYDGANSTTTEISSSTKDFSFSEDGSLLAVLRNNDVEIIDINNPDQNFELSLPDIGEAEKISWYKDNYHIFIFYPNKIEFINLNHQSLESATVAAATTMGAYSSSLNRLYFLKNNQINYLQFPD